MLTFYVLRYDSFYVAHYSVRWGIMSGLRLTTRWRDAKRFNTWPRALLTKVIMLITGDCNASIVRVKILDSATQP